MTEEAVTAVPLTVPCTITLSPVEIEESEEVALPFTIVALVASTE